MRERTEREGESERGRDGERGGETERGRGEKGGEGETWPRSSATMGKGRHTAGVDNSTTRAEAPVVRTAASHASGSDGPHAASSQHACMLPSFSASPGGHLTDMHTCIPDYRGTAACNGHLHAEATPHANSTVCAWIPPRQWKCYKRDAAITQPAKLSMPGRILFLMRVGLCHLQEHGAATPGEFCWTRGHGQLALCPGLRGLRLRKC